ncbi:MAG: NAD(P)H-dependent flavin oxidoreductase [Promethearchaeota archaeon]
MLWKTKITELVKIKYPFIQGAFAGLGRPEFTAAFSNAGGLGILTAINYPSAEQFREAINKTLNLTDKPFGVNFSIMPPMMAKNVPKPRDENFYLEFMDVVLEEGVKICTTSAYRSDVIGKKFKSKGGIWFHKCTLLKHALTAEKLGADAITLVGIEGTGFKNPLQNTTLVNITMARKILNVPIIAAGGIGNFRGFLAAIAMGADAVCFGTAILATKECPASDTYKKRIINQDIFDEDFYNQIYHHQLKDKSIWSMAAGHVEEVLSVKEFLDKISSEAEILLRSWGFTGEMFTTL